MDKLNLNQITRQYRNNGQHAQQLIDYTLNGIIRKHDSVPFDKGSDIPEQKISVKSNRASLMSGSMCKYDTKEEIIKQYTEETASEKFAYVAKAFKVAYIMNIDEFVEFLQIFSTTDRDSAKNGGKIKVRLKAESKKMIEWLERA